MQEKEFDALDASLRAAGGRIIHQIWFNFKDPSGATENPLPEKFVPLREKWITMHPDWMHVMWTDIMGNWLVYKHYPVFWYVYSAYSEPIMRVDALKVCILHRYGGLYADMDTRCLKPIDALLGETRERGIRVAFAKSAMAKMFGSMASNYLIFSEPQEDLWYRVMTGIIQKSNVNAMLPKIANTFLSTGLFQIQKEIDTCTPGKYSCAYGLFDTRDVAAVKEKHVQEYISNNDCYVIHEMENTWVNYADIAQLVIPLLIMVLVIVIAIITLFARHRNSNIKNTPQSIY
jgi:hypothetical protein